MTASYLFNILSAHSRQVNVPLTNSSHNSQFLTANPFGQGTFAGLGAAVSTPQNPEKSLTMATALGSTTTGGASTIDFPALVSSSLIFSLAFSLSLNSSQVIHCKPSGHLQFSPLYCAPNYSQVFLT